MLKLSDLSKLIIISRKTQDKDIYFTKLTAMFRWVQ